ncbi:GLPGLI family protein [Croceiramulus getboli]|nr:GLPGLI family protein [Flavobacteriaceae bacterium YJPT1-3]
MRYFTFFFGLCLLITATSVQSGPQEFQGQATYISKSTLDLGRWGARMSEAQKKQMKDRLKNRLEKTYTLTFNKEESFFDEEEKLDAMSGATDSWGNNFSRGDQYKNIKENQLVQSQEFYGKQFLIKDQLLEVKWVMGSDTKQIGQYTCFKATAVVPSDDLKWYDFSWSELRQAESQTDSTGQSEPQIELTQITAWYSPQIPVSHGPAAYWGLPGLILEVSAGNTTLLCSKITLNPENQMKIEAPDKGKVVTKKEYKTIIVNKMQEMRDNRGRRRS